MRRCVSTADLDQERQEWWVVCAVQIAVDDGSRLLIFIRPNAGNSAVQLSQRVGERRKSPP
jgi:hypothetical protein